MFEMCVTCARANLAIFEPGKTVGFQTVRRRVPGQHTTNDTAHEGTQ